MDEKTWCDCIKAILKRGGRFRIRQMEHDMLRDYGMLCKNNDIAEYLRQLIVRGKVLSAPVKALHGKCCFEYWWVSPDKNKTIEMPQKELCLIDRCIKVARTYPDDHPELKKIMLQIEQIEAQERKVA